VKTLKALTLAQVTFATVVFISAWAFASTFAIVMLLLYDNSPLPADGMTEAQLYGHLWTKINSLKYVAAGLGFLGASMTIWVMPSERDRRLKEDPIEAIRRRVKRVNKAFVEATALADDLQQLHIEQQQALKKTMSEVEEHQRYLEIHPEQAEKVQQLLASGVSAQRRRELIIFITGTILSAALSVPIGIWVNSIS
jgi:hypothetical protein